MNSKSLQLACFYTSGLKPLNHEGILPAHDDWGIKFLHSEDYLPVSEWKKMCENLYMEAKTFLKEENDGVFVRSWEQNGDHLVAFAVGDRESKGAMRRNVLIAIFSLKTDLPLQKLVSEVTFGDEALPNGLKEIKKNPDIDIYFRNQKFLHSIMVKIGPPVEMEKDISKTTSSYMPVPRRRKKNIFPWMIAGAMAIVAMFSIATKKQVTFVPESVGASIQPQIFRDDDRITSLEQERIELQQKLTLVNNKLRDKTYELSEKDSIVTEIGGWESLKVMISISKKYQIDRAEKLQLVLERLKKDLEDSQLKEKTSEEKLRIVNDVLKNQKKDIQDILDRLEEEIRKENHEVTISLGTWKSIQNKMKNIIESE